MQEKIQQEKIEEQNELNREAEMYFIQYLFCTNRMLLLTEFRRLYDAMFDKYHLIFIEGKSENMDLSDINRKFENTI